MDNTEINHTPGLYKILLEDLRPHQPKKYNFIAILLNYRRASYAAVVLYRISAALAQRGRIGKAVSLCFVRLNLALHACEISPWAIIGGGFLLPHPQGITVGMATMGKDVIVMQNATVGIRSLVNGYSLDRADYPVVGDKAIIGPGAAVLGGIKIGAAAVIAANSVVLQDVPDGCTAVGVPAKILPPKA